MGHPLENFKKISLKSFLSEVKEILQLPIFPVVAHATFGAKGWKNEKARREILPYTMIQCKLLYLH